MSSTDEEARRARDTRNADVFASRFDRIDKVIKPWLDKVADKEGK
jgi:hypothetical protein